MPKKKVRKIVKKTVSRPKTAVHDTNSGIWARKTAPSTPKRASAPPNPPSIPLSYVPEDIGEITSEPSETNTKTSKSGFRPSGKPKTKKAKDAFRRDGKFEAEKQAVIEKLRSISGPSLNSAWETVRLASELKNKYHMTAEQIMEAVGRKKTVVYDWLNAAKVSEELKETMPDHQEVYGVHKTLEIGNGYKQLSKQIRSKKSMKDFAIECGDKSTKTARRDWATEEIAKSNEKNAERVQELSGTTEIGDRCKPMDCLVWMDEEAKRNPHSYRVLYSDVPYPYLSCEKLPVDHTQVSGQRVDCENAEYDEALKLSEEIIRKAGALLCKDDKEDCRGGGVLLLMQAGGQHVLLEILEALKETDLEIKFTVQIDTGHSKLANPGHPYGKSSETLLVIKRKDDRMVRCDTRTVDQGPGPGNLLGPGGSVISERQLRKYVYQWQTLNGRELYRYHPDGVIKANASKQHVSSRRRDDYQYGETHLFQKNEAQLLMVLGKHAVAGDKIVDLCGCSGSCCIAADQLNLDWTYIELNKKSYNWGVSRIADYMEAKAKGFPVATDEQLKEYKQRAEAETLSSEDIYQLHKKSEDAKSKKKSNSKSSKTVAIVDSDK